MAPTKKKPARAESSSQSDGEAASQQPSQEGQIKAEDLEEIRLMHNNKIATQRSEGEAKLRTAHKKRVEKIQKKMSECQRKHQERSRDQLRPMLDRLHELLEKKRSLEAKQDEHFQQVTSAMKATVEQLNVAIRDRCDQLADPS